MSAIEPLQLLSFDHITIIVADLDITREFYVNKLGMRETERPAFDFPGAWFLSGRIMVHATLADELSGQAGWGDRKVKRLSRGHHFAFEVADLDRAIEGIELLDIPVADGPKTRPDGFRQIYIYDPDEHLIELFSAPR